MVWLIVHLARKGIDKGSSKGLQRKSVSNGAFAALDERTLLNLILFDWCTLVA